MENSNLEILTFVGNIISKHGLEKYAIYPVHELRIKESLIGSLKGLFDIFPHLKKIQWKDIHIDSSIRMNKVNRHYSLSQIQQYVDQIVDILEPLFIQTFCECDITFPVFDLLLFFIARPQYLEYVNNKKTWNNQSLIHQYKIELACKNIDEYVKIFYRINGNDKVCQIRPNFCIRLEK